MTTPHAANAAPIDVADFAQLLVCEAEEARPGRTVIQFRDVTMVLWRVADRLPEAVSDRTALVVQAVEMAVRAAVASWRAA